MQLCVVHSAFMDYAATWCIHVCRTDAREELRLQLGTLRFDLGVLGEGLGRDKKKEVVALKKNFFTAVRPSLQLTGCPNAIACRHHVTILAWTSEWSLRPCIKACVVACRLISWTLLSDKRTSQMPQRL